jgi:hypothetical protein
VTDEREVDFDAPTPPTREVVGGREVHRVSFLTQGETIAREYGFETLDELTAALRRDPEFRARFKANTAALARRREELLAEKAAIDAELERREREGES